ncbi:tetratricopeptide repeat protein [Microcoleus sp. ZQ-A2]|nr:tetratricopeptide repeat protein [Microcoleus sp. FACHB-1]
MKTLHLDLNPVADNYAQLRFFFDNPNDYQSRSLPLSEIADLIQVAEQDYYVRLAVDYTITGQKLYNWLDGSDRLLSRTMQQHPRDSIVLAIAAAEKLAHLPWEVLHDGNSFLVARMPAVVPVRWVSSDTVKKLSIEGEPENRALNVLFMATSPLGVEPVLDFEAEEGRILEATARQPLALVVEESGCLTELGYLIDDYGKGYFDVLHLTGHATLSDDEPRFNTETETGELYRASAADIAEKLQFRLPQLIFLSGCRTGQGGKSGAVPSLAEELLKLGTKSVLGWGQTVLDTDATAASAALYGALAAGYELTEALSLTYQALIKQQARDWHLLRLYVAGTLPGQLVTTLRTRGRKVAPKPSVAEQFLDPATQKIKVPTRGSFVGRRRQLQHCLRALKPPSEIVGVLIHGMGGLGKSSLAARLCDRLPEFERLVWVGRVDEPSLVNKLGAALDSRELRETLQDDKEELKFRLRRVFRQLEDEAAKPFLLVLDDFEANLEPRNDGYVLQPEVATVLEALVWAIEDTYAPHRLILTCRYDFESTLLRDFYKQPLQGLQGADLRKKCSRLCAFDAKSQVDEALQSQARRLADGNPRLLEWLNKVLLDSTVDREAILQRLEADDRVELREKVLAKSLLEQIDPTLEEILRRGLVYELPVPREALVAVCESIPNLDQQINGAVALGLLEVSPDKSLRVPHILPLKLPEDTEALHKQAAEVLYRFWWGSPGTTITQERVLEIHRLALRAKEGLIAAKIANALTDQWNNLSRFREALQTCQDTLEIVEDYCILSQLARAKAGLGEFDKALEHLQKALNLCPLDHEKAKSAIINNFASVYLLQGEIDEAAKLFQQSLEIDERIDNIRGKAVTLHQLAVIKAIQKQPDEALTLLQQSLELKNCIGDIESQPPTLKCLAQLYAHHLGQVDEAITLLHQCLEIEAGIDHVKGIADTLNAIGSIYSEKLDQVDEAITISRQSLEIYNYGDHIMAKAHILEQLASLCVKQEKIDLAIDYYQQFANHIEARIGNVSVQAWALNEIAYLYAQQGENDQAIDYYQQSLDINVPIDNFQCKATTLHEVADIYFKQGKNDQAIDYYQQALDLRELIGDLQGKAETLAMLGQVLADEPRDSATALTYIHQSLGILQQLHSSEAEKEAEKVQQILTKVQHSEAIRLYNSAYIEAEEGQIEDAIILYKQAVELFERVDDIQSKATTLHNLAVLHTAQGEFEEAIVLYQQSLVLKEGIDNVPGKAATLAMLGQLLAVQGDSDTALDYLQQSLEIFQRLQSPDAETVRQAIARVQ